MSFEAKYAGTCYSIDCPHDHAIDPGDDITYDDHHRTVHIGCQGTDFDPLGRSHPEGTAGASVKRYAKVCPECNMQHAGECL